MNFNYLLPSDIKIIPDRQAFLVELCKDKNVLHLGCVDTGLTDKAIDKGNFLHAKIAQVAKKVIGIDNNADGLKGLEARKGSNEEFLCMNIEKLCVEKIYGNIDIVIAGEVLEHLSNVGGFLEGAVEILKKFNAVMAITVPNAYSIRHLNAVKNGTEVVHPDHNFYFSCATVSALMRKYKLVVKKTYVYNTPFPIRRGSLYPPIKQLWARYSIQRQIKQSPFLSEGLIFIVEPVNENTAC